MIQVSGSRRQPRFGGRKREKRNSRLVVSAAG